MMTYDNKANADDDDDDVNARNTMPKTSRRKRPVTL